ncbi:hypothetical protein BaRGS_00033354 [Batillaria attramentaria]|uniref:Uncharacterized protein n=1 Tax=Batillaria attramentaria TaxID=370345 RepID=A0ABD0JKP9_9CAEN
MAEVPPTTFRFVSGRKTSDNDRRHTVFSTVLTQSVKLPGTSRTAQEENRARPVYDWRGDEMSPQLGHQPSQTGRKFPGCLPWPPGLRPQDRFSVGTKTWKSATRPVLRASH